MPDQRVVLLLQQSGDGPVCRVQREISKIEILCEEEQSIFHIRSEKEALLLPPGEHNVPLSAGEVFVQRLKGSEPATVYAWS